MSASNYNSIPDPLPLGISLIWDYSCGPIYKGPAEALISAGLIQPEWIVDLGKHTRAIVLNADGNFTMPYPEGKRGSYTHEDRRRGLTTIKRAQQPNSLLVTKYRTKEEERELDRLRLAGIDRKLKEQQEESRGERQTGRRDERANDVAIDVKSGVVARAAMASVDIDNLRGYIEPFCGLRFTPESEASILRLCDEMRRAFAEARMVPVVPKYRTEGNVIHFPPVGRRPGP